VIKLRPPLIFSESDANLFCEALGEILQEDAAQPIPSAVAPPPASLYATQ